MNTSFLTSACAGALLFVSAAAHADQLKIKASALSPQDAAALKGKTVAVVLHERESYTWMTPGKVMFGLLGVAAMIKAGNDFVAENQIPDPTALMRDQLATALRDRFGAQPASPDTTTTKAHKPAELAKLHPETDYVLSVKHNGTMSSYYPGNFGRYWIANSFLVQLVDTKSGRELTHATCFASIYKNPVRPSNEQLRANQAQLAKDILASLTWRCARQVSIDALKLAPEQAPAIPAEMVDPLTHVAEAPATSAPADADASATAKPQDDPSAEPESTPEPASETNAPETASGHP